MAEPVRFMLLCLAPVESKSPAIVTLKIFFIVFPSF